MKAGIRVARASDCGRMEGTGDCGRVFSCAGVAPPAGGAMGGWDEIRTDPTDPTDISWAWAALAGAMKGCGRLKATSLQTNTTLA